ncbi:uncharacterized protein LOC119160878 [Rhipicephalus microplus]|uniref:uncharacterized protein LOC119160878 n=1 Tax=Rhipicephalus microplus TaxID=6941 RepID=UPI001888E9EC|nr:uncharacterized protein LOC119160878 [Rhipicephalus microplus]
MTGGCRIPTGSRGALRNENGFWIKGASWIGNALWIGISPWIKNVEDMNGFLAKCLLMGLATGTVALIIGPDYAEAVALSTGGFLDVLGKLFGRNAETSKK